MSYVKTINHLKRFTCQLCVFLLLLKAKQTIGLMLIVIQNAALVIKGLYKLKMFKDGQNTYNCDDWDQDPKVSSTA